MRLKQSLGSFANNRFFNRIREIYNNTSDRTLIIIAMIISAIFWSAIGGYLKTQRYYADEWIYLQTAYSIKNGYGLTGFYGIEGLGAGYNRYVYSLLIVPACFITNISLRFKVIALINAISLSSAAIPVYLLSCRMNISRNKSLIAVVISLTMPYMNYSACFMSENAFIPIGAWLVYFNYMLIRAADYTRRENIRRIVLTIVFVVLAYYTKGSGKMFAYIEALTLLLSFLYYRRERLRKYILRYLGIVAAIAIASFSAFFYLASYTGENATLQQLAYFANYGVFARFSFNDTIYWDSILTCIISFLMLFCIIPVIYHWFSIKSLSFGDKLFSFWLFILTCLFMIEVVRLSYVRYPANFSDVHSRYIVCVLMPIIVIFFKGLEQETEHRLSEIIILCVVMLALWALVLFFYRGVTMEWASSCTDLYWVVNNGDWHVDKMGVSLIIMCIISLFIYLFANCPKKIFTLFLILWIPIQLYNNVMCHSAFVSENALEESSSMLELRDFVLEHDDDTFLLVDRCNPREGNDSFIRGDAYLDTTNIIRFSPYLLFSASYPCDLNEFYETYSPDTDLSHVQYLLLCSDFTLSDSTGVTNMNVGDGTWYTLYRLDTTGVLPTVELVEE